MNKVKFGIIGVGTIGPIHAKAISQLELAELCGIADTRAETAKLFAEEFHVDTWYTDYLQLLKREDINVINICTPPYLHEEMTIAAAKEGKHVLVEKPMAVSLREADRMIYACEKAGAKLGVIFQSRFSKDVKIIKEAIDRSDFGKLLMGDAYVKWFRTQEYYDSAAWRGTWNKEGGGAIINQAIHTIDLLQWFMGDVDSLFAFIDTAIHKIEVEDVAVAALRFKNGAMGVIEASTAMHLGFPQRLEIHGDKGTAILEGNTIELCDFSNKSEKRKEYNEVRGFKDKILDTPASSPIQHSVENHKLQIKDFVEAIVEDREPLINGREGRKSLEIIKAIYKSAKTRKMVKLPIKEC